MSQIEVVADGVIRIDPDVEAGILVVVDHTVLSEGGQFAGVIVPQMIKKEDHPCCDHKQENACENENSSQDFFGASLFGGDCFFCDGFV